MDKLRLARVSGVGPVAYARLLADHGSASAALAALPEISRKRKKPLEVPSDKVISAEIAIMEKLGGRYVFWREEDYPTQLGAIEDPPPVLCVLGDAALLSRRQIGMVGNRNASAAGLQLTKEMAKDFVQAGLVVTSGLARGIDGAAHEGALEAEGKTIAVLGCGVDVVYPPQHKGLYERILAEGGCIVSENAPQTQPTAQLFPRRNRIISGLSLGIVVTEASRHSGSLITAQYAGEQGREVFAVPGSPKDARAAGPNHLLKQGAHLVTEASEVLEELPKGGEDLPKLAAKVTYMREETRDLFAAAAEEATPAPLEDTADDKTKLMNFISTTPTEVDVLIRESGLAQTEVMLLLGEMDLMGEIRRTADGRVVLP